MSPEFSSSKPRTPPPGASHIRQKDSHPHCWKRFQKTLLCSVIWLALLLSAAVFHISVIHGGKLGPAEDAALSERYGMIGGAGLVGIVAFIFSRRKARD